MNCLNHSNKLAEYHCVSCDGYFCPNCIKDLKINGMPTYICLVCKGRCVSIERLIEAESEQKQIEFARDFWWQLVRIFAFPFNGKGIYILMKGTIGFIVGTFPLFLMAKFPSEISVVFAGVLAPFVLLFAVACFFKRVRSER